MSLNIPENILDSQGVLNPVDYANYLRGQFNIGSTQPLYTPHGMATAGIPEDSMSIDERIAALDEYRKSNARSSMEGSLDNNILQNAIGNVQRIGTGMTYAGTHIPELAKGAYEWATSDKSFADKFSDVADLLLSSYDTKLSDFGTLPAKDIIIQAAQGIYKNPVDFLMDVTSLGGAKVIGKLFPQIGKGFEVEKGLASAAAEVGDEVNKLEKSMKNYSDVVKKGGVASEKIIESAETGKRLATAEERAAKDALYDQFQQYHELTKTFSPETVRDPMETSIVQMILRDRLAKGIDTTYEAVRKEVIPYIEKIGTEGGLTEIKQSAKAGDMLARDVMKGKVLFDKKDIFPVTHGLANIEKTTTTMGTIGEMAEGVARAGRFSNRIWGTSSYGDIAKQLQSPDKFLQHIAESYVSDRVTSNILSGKIGGVTDIISDGSKKITYLDRGLLEQGKLKDALNAARDNRVLPTDIAMDKYIFKALKEQLNPDGALTGLTNDLFQTGKSTLLAGGTYLGANMTTGLTNTILNSGAFVIDDILNAIKSKGELAKIANTYRRESQMKYSQQAVLKGIQKANQVFGGGLWQNLDRKQQNIWAEAALHAELRKKGVSVGERAEALRQMDKAELADAIVSSKRVANLNSSNVPLPAILQNTAFMANPFWRWGVTATLSAEHMLRTQPILANVALMDIIGNISFDKEMQNRLNLGVSLDRPYVSFKEDPRTGKPVMMGAEFIPLTTTLRMLDFTNPQGNPTVGGLTNIINALGGKDQYGRLRKRAEVNGVKTIIDGSKRFITTPDGRWQDATHGYGDEMLSTVINTFLGAPKMLNKTVLPALAPLLSPTGEYYQPYDNALFGSYTPDERNGNFLFSPNIDRNRSVDDVVRGFIGQYEQDYRPSREERGLPLVSPRNAQRMLRSYNRYQSRRLYGGQ